MFSGEYMKKKNLIYIYIIISIIFMTYNKIVPIFDTIY